MPDPILVKFLSESNSGAEDRRQYRFELINLTFRSIFRVSMRIDERINVDPLLYLRELQRIPKCH